MNKNNKEKVEEKVEEKAKDGAECDCSELEELGYNILLEKMIRKGRYVTDRDSLNDAERR